MLDITFLYSRNKKLEMETGKHFIYYAKKFLNVDNKNIEPI